MRVYKIIAILILILTITSKAQSQKRDNTLKFNVSFGIPYIPKITTDYFGDNSYYFYPKYSIRIGFEYGPIFKLMNARIYVAADAGYLRGDTKEFKYSSDGKMKVSFSEIQMPILLWMRITTVSKLSPYLQLGIGGTRIDFRKNINLPTSDAYNLHNYQICLGLGAGLNYKLSKVVNIGLSANIYTTYKDLIFKNDCTDSGIEGIHQIGEVNFKIGYNLSNIF